MEKLNFEETISKILFLTILAFVVVMLNVALATIAIINNDVSIDPIIHLKISSLLFVVAAGADMLNNRSVQTKFTGIFIICFGTYVICRMIMSVI